MRRYVKRLVGAGVVGLGFAVGVNYDGDPEGARRGGRGGGAPAARSPAPHALPRHQQGGVGGHRRRPVPRGDGRIRGAARADAAGADATARRACSPRSPRRWTAGPRCTTRPAPSSPPRPSGPDAGRRGSPPTWSGCGSGPRRRARWSAARRRRTGSNCTPWAPDAGRAPRWPWARRAALGTAERYAVHSAIALLTLTTERSRSLQAAEQRLGAAVLRMLLAGQPDHARAVAGDLYGGLLDAPFRLLIAELGGASRTRAARATRCRPSPNRWGPRPSRGAGEPCSSCRTIDGRARGAGRRTAARSSRPARAAYAGQGGRGRGRAGRGALGARPGRSPRRPRTNRPNRRCRWPGGAGGCSSSTRSWPRGPSCRCSRTTRCGRSRTGCCGALYEHDATGRGDLVASLRAWLSRHGQWDAAAADLGVHRHTLRYRMRRVEEILGRSLDDPDVRMELWLALKTTAGGEGITGGAARILPFLCPKSGKIVGI